MMEDRTGMEDYCRNHQLAAECMFPDCDCDLPEYVEFHIEEPIKELPELFEEERFPDDGFYTDA